MKTWYAVSGETMKKKDSDADLRWIHGVIVQAAWFVKASLERMGNSPKNPDGWISCSDAVPADFCDVIQHEPSGMYSLVPGIKFIVPLGEGIRWLLWTRTVLK